MSTELKKGDRVRHVHADLRGVVDREPSGGYVHVRWDHFGLAVAALGTMADLQRSEQIEHDTDGDAA